MNPQASTDAEHRSPNRRMVLLGAHALVVVTLLAPLSACTKNNAAQPNPTSASVTVNGSTHKISGAVECTNSSANPHATPAETGSGTTRVSAHDDSGRFNLALSNDTPPRLDGFALSLTVDNGEYEMPYQSALSSNQITVTRQGNTYTVKGTGASVTRVPPGQSANPTFEIDVACP